MQHSEGSSEAQLASPTFIEIEGFDTIEMQKF